MLKWRPLYCARHCSQKMQHGHVLIIFMTEVLTRKPPDTVSWRNGTYPQIRFEFTHIILFILYNLTMVTHVLYLFKLLHIQYFVLWKVNIK